MEARVPDARDTVRGTSHARPSASVTTPWRLLRVWLMVVADPQSARPATCIGGWSLTDAFYMASITLTTVGFREVRELDEALRLWTTVLAITGVALIFGTVGIITEELVGTRRAGDGAVHCYGRATTSSSAGTAASVAVAELRTTGTGCGRRRQRAADRSRGRTGFVVAGALRTTRRPSAGVDRACGLTATMDLTRTTYAILSARAQPEPFIVGRARRSGRGEAAAPAPSSVSPYDGRSAAAELAAGRASTSSTRLCRTVS
jgi:hypothetical protein